MLLVVIFSVVSLLLLFLYRVNQLGGSTSWRSIATHFYCVYRPLLHFLDRTPFFHDTAHSALSDLLLLLATLCLLLQGVSFRLLRLAAGQYLLITIVKLL